MSNILNNFKFHLKIGKLKNVFFGSNFCCMGKRKLKLGDNIRFGNGVRIQAEGISIGSGSFIGHNNYLYGKIIIGENFMSGPNVSIMAGNHGFAKTNIPMKEQETTSKGIQISDDVWIGTNAVLLDGINVGKGVIIGAGSVVTRDLDEYGIYAGNPAKLIKKR